MASIDLGLLSSFERFALTELDQVPTKPGVYAWYAKPQIGTADWKGAKEGERDVGEERFRTVLSRQTERFQPPPLKTQAHGTFRDTWTGHLSPTRYQKHVAAVRNPELQDEEAKSLMYPKRELANILKSEKLRGQMARLLGTMCAPIFSAPLYIGKADDLRERLTGHAAGLARWHSVFQRDPLHRESLRQHLFEGRLNEKIEDSFATRAAAAGFGPEGLEVYVLDIEEALEVPTETARYMAASIEWFLNTWNRPIFGRA